MKTRGFTLIELLVVIAIIGVLSSVVLASLSTARAKARNAQRLSDLHQLQNALELYASDHDGKYPVQGNWMGTTPGCYGNPGDPNAAIPGLVPTYISKMPQDPKPIMPSFCYLYTTYSSNGSDYKIITYGTYEGTALSPGAPNARYPFGCGAAEGSLAVYTAAFACL